MSDTLTVSPRETPHASLRHTQQPNHDGNQQSAGIRLRRGVSSRSIQGRGVAISSGSTAVVINGNTAEKLWQYLEPRLRAGTTPTELSHALPASTAKIVRGLVEELESHDLLCVVEESIGSNENLPGIVHFEKTARRPVAAARRMAGAELRLTASNTQLFAECKNALEEAGFKPPRENILRKHGPESVLQTPQGIETAELHILGPAGWKAVAMVLESAGWRVVGPTNGYLDSSQWPLLLDWARKRPAGFTLQHPAVSRLGSRLAATQLALAAMAAMDEKGQDDNDAVFMVTNPDIVSEPHPLFGLAPLGNGSHARKAIRVWGDRELAAELESPQPDPSEALPGYEQLWQGVLNPWNGPDPQKMGQLPLGIATASFSGAVAQGFNEIGMTTASARINALEVLATLWAGTAEPGWVRHVGHTRLAAVAGALVHSLDEKPGWVHEPGPTTCFTARSRRLWAALTLRFGIEATLLTECWHGGQAPIFRVTVKNLETDILGRGISPHREVALEEALIRAVGTAQIAVDKNTANLLAPATLGMELGETRRLVTSWAAGERDRLGLSILTPGGTERWLNAGLHVVDIRWEEKP